MGSTSVITAPWSASLHVVLGSTVGHIQQGLEDVMSGIEREAQFQQCEPMSDVEKHFNSARRDLQILVSFTSLRDINSSNVGKFEPHEVVVLDKVRRQRRHVAELIAKMDAQRKLISLRRLTHKALCKCEPSSSKWKIKAVGPAWFTSTSRTNSMRTICRTPRQRG